MTRKIETPLLVELRNDGRRVVQRVLVQELDDLDILIRGEVRADEYIANSATIVFKDNRVEFHDRVFAGTRIKLMVDGQVMEYPEDDENGTPAIRQVTAAVDYTFTEDYDPEDAAGIIANEIGLADAVGGYEEIESLAGSEVGTALILADQNGNPIMPRDVGLLFPSSNLPDDLANLLQRTLTQFGVT